MSDAHIITVATRKFAAKLRAFGRARDGNAAVIFGLVLPVILGSVGVGVDYGVAARLRGRMQAAADASAINAALEFQMVQANVEKVTAVARNYAQQIDGVAIDVKVDTVALTVTVTLDKDSQGFFGSGATHVRASSTARMTSGLPLCMLALEPTNRAAITLQTNARMTAPACVVNSNSISPQGLISMDNAVLQAGLICSAGGKVKTTNTNYTPDPRTDCPVMPDPLAGRQAPAVTACSFNDTVLSGSIATLTPGVYCGGLKVTNGATVTLTAGTYIIKDGPLIVDGGASLKGSYVSFFLKGAGSNLLFDTSSSIYLSAGKSGPLSGILIYDDPSGAPAPEISGRHDKWGKSPREHSILSDDARLLLGTIYMPKGRLIVDATKPIADKSAYTVLVLQQLDLYDGPNLVLNTDYRASDVPVPEGVGPYGGKVLLAR